jgi:hypothetical protein
MTYSLADEEIRLLKALRGAGDRGRPVPQAPLMIARLIKARYVERRVIDGTSTRYVITDFGRISLDRYYDGATLMPCRFPPPW